MTRVADLAGAELALWVAHIAGVSDPVAEEPTGCWCLDEKGWPMKWAPHEDWSQGGPLIEKHDIVVERVVTSGDLTLHYQARKYPHSMIGPTYLVAAMRSLVASVYGESVPEEPT